MQRSGKRQFNQWQWTELKRKYSYRCLRCGIKEDKEKPSTKLTADHVIPLKLGGWRGIENIQPLCFKCNLAKGADTTDYRWRKFKN